MDLDTCVQIIAEAARIKARLHKAAAS
jgi:hypothetical protein